ncbi:MAG TPA: gamma-glutamylcyclotransferase [Rhodanobacteraceae bacterium]
MNAPERHVASSADAGLPADVGRDTTRINRARQDFAGVDSVWLFGYGSLIYKVGFPYLERRRATLRGWSRRFWQGSHDHRGTPGHPGRVVTLIRAPDAACVGVAYRITPATFGPLDVREKNGYLRCRVRLEVDAGDPLAAIAYIAPEGNAAWLGPADPDVIARHIAAASGPSGSNRDYALQLADALRALHADDPHVFDVAARLRALIGVQGTRRAK